MHTILWINGAFGSGKTSVAEALHKKIARSHIYDPEQAGYFLWDNFPEELRCRGNFQHIDLWRDFNYKFIKYVYAHYDGTLIVPMTIYIPQYYEEIVGRLLGEGCDLHHFILRAERETLLARLKSRDDPDDSFAVQHIDRCLDAYASTITEKRIDTDTLCVEDIVSVILKQINFPS